METLIQERVDFFSDPAQRVGANYVPGKGVYIRLWAPKLKDVKIIWNDDTPRDLQVQDRGYYSGFFPDKKPGDLYQFISGGKSFADPASLFQPKGPTGPSEVVDSDFNWTDRAWQGIPFEKWVIYEIHPGTFSEAGDFQGIIKELPRLKDLGITTLEIMPVSQFSGERNWGYDGVFPHSVQNSYGGPNGLKALVDAAHELGLAVILDCVYNHIGPEGNVLFQCGPYTTGNYNTPWGDALNYDSEDSEDVRLYFLQTIWQWLTEFHLDGLRLDAIQMIFDTLPVTFLEEISRLKLEAEKIVGRPLVLTGESDMNDPKVLRPLDEHGLGFDGQWADDFHHCLHVTLTGENKGYYQDYGGVAQLADIYRNGVAFTGQYAPFHKRRHGRSYEGIPKNKLIVEVQNHDQIGNRAFGERLIKLVEFDKVKLAAACIFLSPFTPFLFMGEEYGAEQPFLYFVSHRDDELNGLICEGRANEWKSFNWSDAPPDPADEETFRQCILRRGPNGDDLQFYYKTLIALSKELRLQDLQVENDDNHIVLTFCGKDVETKVILSFDNDSFNFTVKGNWQCLLNSSQYQTGALTPSVFDGTVAPFSAIVLRKSIA